MTLISFKIIFHGRFEELEKLSDDTSQLLSYAMNMDIVSSVLLTCNQVVS